MYDNPYRGAPIIYFETSSFEFGRFRKIYPG